MLAQSILLPYTCVYVCVCVRICDVCMWYLHGIYLYETRNQMWWYYGLWGDLKRRNHALLLWHICVWFEHSLWCATQCVWRIHCCCSTVIEAALFQQSKCGHTHVYECDPCKNALVSTFHTCVVHTCPCTTGAHVCLRGSAISCCSLSLYLSLSLPHPVSLLYHPFSIALLVTGKPCYVCALLYGVAQTRRPGSVAVCASCLLYVRHCKELNGRDSLSAPADPVE